MNCENQKALRYYLSLPWTFIINEEDDDPPDGKIYIIRIKELPGVVTDAPSLEEAMESIKEAMLLSFEMSLEAGDKIPTPVIKQKFN